MTFSGTGVEGDARPVYSIVLGESPCRLRRIHRVVSVHTLPRPLAGSGKSMKLIRE